MPSRTFVSIIFISINSGLEALTEFQGGFHGFTEAELSEARQQIADMALHVGFEEVAEDDVEYLLLSHREELGNEDLMVLE